MASIIPGYEYDIFISYRQKDNKGDRWVSEFVDALKTELESTFKEEISVYFDINPHDGLLETHDVDASLKGKLKCLVFIPIISQTYCDSKSFAWQHEFVAFNQMAKEDQFGRDIKLAGGNVASRILPVKIHDLDVEDKTLLENELGGVLRCIEFIYKSSGVNRPLRANEDHPQENLNKTYYRDQINKIANAIKEIICGDWEFDIPLSPEDVRILHMLIHKLEIFGDAQEFKMVKDSVDRLSDHFNLMQQHADDKIDKYILFVTRSKFFRILRKSEIESWKFCVMNMTPVASTKLLLTFKII